MNYQVTSTPFMFSQNREILIIKEVILIFMIKEKSLLNSF